MTIREALNNFYESTPVQVALGCVPVVNLLVGGQQISEHDHKFKELNERVQNISIEKLKTRDEGGAIDLLSKAAPLKSEENWKYYRGIAQLFWIPGLILYGIASAISHMGSMRSQEPTAKVDLLNDELKHLNTEINTLSKNLRDATFKAAEKRENSGIKDDYSTGSLQELIEDENFAVKPEELVKLYKRINYGDEESKLSKKLENLLITRHEIYKQKESLDFIEKIESQRNNYDNESINRLIYIEKDINKNELTIISKKDEIQNLRKEFISLQDKLHYLDKEIFNFKEYYSQKFNEELDFKDMLGAPQIEVKDGGEEISQKEESLKNNLQLVSVEENIENKTFIKEDSAKNIGTILSEYKKEFTILYQDYTLANVDFNNRSEEITDKISEIEKKVGENKKEIRELEISIKNLNEEKTKLITQTFPDGIPEPENS